MPYQYKREPLTSEEADRLINACEGLKEKFVVWTLLDTGLRVSELAGLRKDQIQWQEGRIMLYGKGGPYGKSTKRRIVPMTTRVRTLFEAYFAVQDGVKMTKRTAQRIVKKVANRAGITKPVTPHVLRHTFAVNCIRRGISTRALMEFLGHDRLETTEIYLNLSPEDAIREFKEKW